MKIHSTHSRIVALVQARMSSTRLPGKVLADVAGQSVLMRTVHRVARSRRLDEVVVATSDQAVDDPIAALARRKGVPVSRGSAMDVLDRFLLAARERGADVIVRITADCPLVEPELIDRCVEAFFTQSADHASNAYVRRYPRGLDVEVIRLAALKRAGREARLPFERAHVTPYIHQHPELFRLVSVEGEADYVSQRWTVDTPDDLAFVRAVYDRLGPGDEFSWRAVIELLEREPELAQLNAGVMQKALVEG